MDLLFRELSPQSINIRGFALQQILVNMLRPRVNVLFPLPLYPVRRHGVHRQLLRPRLDSRDPLLQLNYLELLRRYLYCLMIHLLQFECSELCLLPSISLVRLELLLHFGDIRFDGSFPLMPLLLS